MWMTLVQLLFTIIVRCVFGAGNSIFFRVYKLYRIIPKFGGTAPPGLHSRNRPQGPRRQPRTQRTDDLWHRQHVLRHHHHTAGCSRCGRTSKAQRQGRLQQWRRPCQPLAVHLRRLAHGHRPQWQGHWRCLMCPSVGRIFQNAPVFACVLRGVGGRHSNVHHGRYFPGAPKPLRCGRQHFSSRRRPNGPGS